MTQADAILDYLRAHPGARSLEIAKAIGINRRHAIRTLHRLCGGGLARSAPESPRARAALQWWIVEVEAAEDWHARVRDALGFAAGTGSDAMVLDEIARLRECDSDRTRAINVIPGILQRGTLEETIRVLLDDRARLCEDLAVERTTPREIDAEIIRTIVTLAETYAPDGSMPLVDYLSGTLGGMNLAIASLKARLAEERAPHVSVTIPIERIVAEQLASYTQPAPSIAGLPLPAAIALIASAAGVDVDYADGWPTITPRVIGEIVRVLSTVGSA